ncbi:MAG: hypothetical protein E6686_03915 [Lachnospiraceae bacterium]|nr:hypothetical protein [Lachnospiraceae bacterium]
MRIKRILAPVICAVNVIGYIITLPVALFVRFLQKLEEFELPGLFSMGIMLYMIYLSWKEIVVMDGIPALVLIKYFFLFGIVAGTGCAVIGIMLEVLLSLLGPIQTLNINCKSRTMPKQLTLDEYIREMDKVAPYGLVKS